MKGIQILLFICFGQICYAQSSALRMIGEDFWISENYFESNWAYKSFDNLPYLGLSGSVISESNGTPLFGQSFFNLVNLQDGSVISGSDSTALFFSGSCWFQRNDSVYDLIGYFDSSRVNEYKGTYFYFNLLGNGYLFDSLENFHPGFYRHTVTKTSEGWQCTESNKLLIQYPFANNESWNDKNQYVGNGIKAYHISDYKYLYLVNSYLPEGRNLKLYSVENGEMILKDNLDIGDSKPFFREPLYLPETQRMYSLASIQDAVINFNKTKLFYTARGFVDADTKGLKWDLSSYYGLYVVDLDPVSLKITSTPKEFWYYQTPPDLTPGEDSTFYREEIIGLAFSSNDSFLYFTVRQTERNIVNGKNEWTHNSELKYWNYHNLTFAPESLRNKVADGGSGQQFQLNPYGKIVTTFEDKGVLLPNSNSPNKESTKFVTLPTRSAGIGRELFYYDYARFKDSITYDCKAHVQMHNKSDLSGGMNSFTWYFTKEDGKIDTLIGFESRITYSKNGDYAFKCRAYSPSGNGGKGYGEIYIDTLHIRIPPKPVAAFTAQDTIVCAYSQAKFINQSTADTIHPANGEKWVWTFGDGTTQTVLSPESKSPVAHIYKAPGTYTVSLFYSNGFCDSTLVKNQYITVVDAPAPGFSVDNVQGCSPFTVNVSDTVTLNTVKKEYLIGNQLAFKDTLPFSGTWDEYYSLPFGEGRDGAFTFSIPGSYWITQKLYGYTGCITQLDSVQIFVSPGFTTSDTSHISNATYQDILPNSLSLGEGWGEAITLTWPCLAPSATSYIIYRNGIKIATLEPSCINGEQSYIDSLKNQKPQFYTYTLAATDSCGTATQVGRIGQPIYLSGQVKGNNELSILQFNNYLDWNVGVNEINYTIQTENDGMWQSLASQNNNADYTDKQFLDLANQGVKLEKCYRIVGESNNQKTISNILCLPYSPVLFIPTAITPNADGLNDVFKPITFGIASYNVQIYNRWGQLVADFDETSPGWTAKEMPQGAFMVTIRAKGNDNNWYTENSTVTVVR